MFSRQRKQPASPLANSQLDVRILDLVAEHKLIHRFENRSNQPLEVVYSFPLPLDAAFMGLTATLAGQTLTAQVQAKALATRRYDDAIADGHSAVLLSQPEPGVLCVNLGNLLPGERGEIELRFATALRVDAHEAHYNLPLVHRPRYGRWRLEELEAPTTNFAAEHPLGATIEVHGLLAHATARCNSHGASFRHEADALRLTIEAAMLDRDLSLGFALDTTLPASVQLIRDGEQNLALASLVLPPRAGAAKPLDLCLLLDGSGSMAGDAVQQSRRALAATADALHEADRLQVIRFGSEHAALFRRPLKLTPAVREAVHQLVDVIDADLGGTEMGAALSAALASFSDSDTDHARAVILVTDGAVQPEDIATAQREAQARGIRIFVVAVGSAAGTEVLLPLAIATGAMLERAVPGEPIDACVLRQLRRAHEAHALALTLHDHNHALPLIPGEPAYPGDAIALATVLPATDLSAPTLRVPELDFTTTLNLPEASDAPALRALLGQRRYAAAPAAERQALALRYGLLTTETAAVLVRERAINERPDALPHIVAVEAMLPAGMLSARQLPPDVAMHSKIPADVGYCAFEPEYGVAEYQDMPTFLRRSNAPEPKVSRPSAAALSPPTLARTLLHALYLALLSQLGHGQFNLERAIVSLPADGQAHLRTWLDWRLPAATQCHIADLLIALQQVLGEPPLDDARELALALLRRGASTDTADRLVERLHHVTA